MSFNGSQRWKTWSWVGMQKCHIRVIPVWANKRNTRGGEPFQSSSHCMHVTPPPLPHTSHRILDPQDASDKVRGLTEHPESQAVNVTFLTFNVRSAQSDGHGERRDTSPIHMSHHLLPNEQLQLDRHTHGRTSRWIWNKRSHRFSGQKKSP